MGKMKTQKSTYASPRKVCEEKNKNKNENHAGKILQKF